MEKTAELELLISGSEEGNLLTGDCKFQWIDEVLNGGVERKKEQSAALSKFDRLATSRRWGKPIAIVIILLGLVASFCLIVPIWTYKLDIKNSMIEHINVRRHQ